MNYIPIAMMRTACDMAQVIGLENMIDGTFGQVMEYVRELRENPVFYRQERDKFCQRAQRYAEHQGQLLKSVVEAMERQAGQGPSGEHQT